MVGHCRRRREIRWLRGDASEGQTTRTCCGRYAGRAKTSQKRFLDFGLPISDNTTEGRAQISKRSQDNGARSSSQPRLVHDPEWLRRKLSRIPIYLLDEHHETAALLIRTNKELWGALCLAYDESKLALADDITHCR